MAASRESHTLPPFVLSFLLLLLSSSLPHSSALWLPRFISSNMILPRAPQTATIWGLATPSSVVSVHFGDDGPYTSTADSITGAWTVNLPPLSPTSLPSTLSVDGDFTSLSFSNIKVGDVLLCSGQSNMAMTVSACDNAASEIAAASSYPHMSLFAAAPTKSNTSLDDVPVMLSYPEATGWVPTAVSTVSSDYPFWGMSALCYSTGRRVYDALGGKVPIGLVVSANGGTMVEEWLRPEQMTTCGAPDTQAAELFSGCYNGQIHPIRYISPAATLWYQGESNAYDPARYACTFPTLIDDWRSLFQLPTMPFYFVLLANWAYGGDNWALLRDAQLVALDLPMTHTGAVSAIDTANADDVYDIHPRNKTAVAVRLAAHLLSDLYSIATPTRGPSFSSATAMYSAVTAQLNVSVAFTVGDAAAGTGLVAMATPGCIACCTVKGNAKPMWRVKRVVGEEVVYTTVDSWTVQGTQVTMSAPAAAADGWAAATSLILEFQWFDVVECMLYNANLLPANPWAKQVQLGAQTGSSGALPVITTSSSSAAVVRMASSSTGQSPSDPAGKGEEESSGASPALLAMVIVFLVLSLLCSAVFVWQYRMRHGSLCCKNEGAEGGRVGSQGMGDWLENTMGVGKKMQWKRGLTDQDLLKQVASDRYD